MGYTIDDLDRQVARQFEDGYDDAAYFDSGSSGTWHAFQEEMEYGNDDRTVVLDGIGTARVTEDVGGEGEGDTYYLVFTVTDNDNNSRFFKRHGWYASHNGGFYEGPTEEVHPVQKIVTVYEPIAA